MNAKPIEPMDLDTAAADPAVVAVAREWLLICKTDYNEWPDMTAEDLAELPAERVVLAVEKLWGGGLAAFLADSAADIDDQRRIDREAAR